MGVFKDVIVETLPGKEFLDKYNIDIVTILTVLFALVILLMVVEFFQEKEEHKLNYSKRTFLLNIIATPALLSPLA